MLEGTANSCLSNCWCCQTGLVVGVEGGWKLKQAKWCTVHVFFFFFLALKPFPVSQHLIVIQRGGHSDSELLMTATDTWHCLRSQKATSNSYRMWSSCGDWNKNLMSISVHELECLQMWVSVCTRAAFGICDYTNNALWLQRISLFILWRFNPFNPISRQGELRRQQAIYRSTYVWVLLTCDDKCVGNSGLSEHALYVAGEELEGLAATTVRVHQYHDSARPTHLCIRSTWDRQREVKVRQRWSKRTRAGLVMHDQMFQRIYKERLVPRGGKVTGCDSIQIDNVKC